MENAVIAVDYKSQVEAQISEIIENHTWWTGTFEKIDKTVRRLEKLVCLEETDTYDFAERIWNETPAETLRLMNDGYCRWETEVENKFAYRILTEPNVKSEDYLLYERFFRLLSKEIRLLNDNSFQTILFIGSGPFPITAILLHALTGKTIDCLEQHEESANISRKVLAKLGLADAIRVHVGNGCTFDMSPYDVVLAALLAKPKADILKNIIENGNPDCKVLCRTSHGLRRLLYEPTLYDAFEGFDIHDTQRAGDDDTISTILLTPRRAEHLKFEWLEKLGPQEIAALADLSNSIIAQDNNNGYVRKRHADDYFYSQLKGDVEAGLKRIMVIRDDKRYYGQVVITLFHQDTYIHRGDICSLMLHKSARSRRVSLQIAEHLIRECERLDLGMVTIDVRAGSSQEKLWRYLGFTPYGQLPKYAKVNDTYFSGVFLFQEMREMKTVLKRRLEAMYATKDISPLV